MNTTMIDTEKQQLVTLARKVERLIAKRRKAAKVLRDVEDELRQARRFLQQLAMPTPEPINRGEHEDLLPGESTL
jgi:hypothetical protein